MTKPLACLFAAIALPAFSQTAGQSVQYGPQNIYSLAIPNTLTNRVEFRVLGWPANAYTHLIAGTGLWPTYYGASGWSAYFADQTGVGEGISIRSMFDNGPGVFIPLDGLSVEDVRVRPQHDPANKIDHYEAWDNQGNLFFTSSPAYTTETVDESTGTGFGMGYGNEPTISVAFMRMSSTLVPLGSRAPVTYDPDPSLVFEWQGSLNDSTANGYDATAGSGPALTYSATPATGPVAVIKAAATLWSPVTTLRAGFANTLDGTSSYSMSDTTNAVSCSWTQLSGISRAIFDNASSCAPSVTGLIFGQYVFQLTVCDVSGACSTTSAIVGAVAMDSKGIVVNANPIVDALFGPMIAWGRNPFGGEDAMQMHVLHLRGNDYLTSGWVAHIWEQTGAGTVSYKWDGVGLSGGDNSCPDVLTADITPASASIQISNAACLDLTSFPTRIWLSGTEEVRISASSATSGPATLTVATRGSGNTTAAAWSGVTIGQYKVTGTGTDFFADPNATVCLAGAAPGATALIDLRAHLTVDTTGIGEWYWKVTGCESPTALYINPNISGHNFGGNSGLLQAPMLYSVDQAPVSWISNGALGGEFFYNEPAAWLSIYYSSGLDEAKNTADIVDDCLVCSPDGNPEGNGYPPLITGGPVIGAFFAAALGRPAPPWANLRSYAQQGENYVNDIAAHGCSIYDARNTGYAYEWLGYDAIYDPDPVWQAKFKADLPQMAANDLACKTADNSFTNSYLFNPAGSINGGLGDNGGFGPLTLTNGSTVVSAPGGLPAAACIGTASGTATVTNGSSIVTAIGGSFPTSGFDALTVSGMSGGQPFSSQYMFDGTNLAVNWPWDSGTIGWMTTATSNGNGHIMIVFGTGNNDSADLARGFNCIANADGTLALDHPWPGATGSNYVGNSSNIVGNGEQPFYIGVRSLGTGFLSRVTDPALSAVASFYKTLSAGIASWLHDVGTDIASLTTNYGIGYGLCGPVNPPASSVPFSWKSPACNYSSAETDSMTVGREQNSEIMSAISEYYLANPTPANKTWGDRMYGAVFGTAAYNTSGAYWDAASVATNTAPANWGDVSWHAGKWPGFFFGMGMPRRWPAVRLGGVDPPNMAAINIPFTLGGVARAAQVRVTVTAPTGKAVPTVCAVSPCSVSVDKRSGSVLIEMDYIDLTGAMVRQGENIPLYVTSL
jgi:hypothetical protein